MERLQKVIAKSGIASRRKAELLIAQGQVKVNGKVVTEMGVKVGARERIEVSGVPIEQESHVYYAFYKPRGVISAVTDDKDRRVVNDYFLGIEQHVFPVGRLDYDTSGLLLMTNDGEFTYHLTHPKHQVPKTYVAKVKGIVMPHDLQPLKKGLKIDGRKTAEAKCRILSCDKIKGTTIVELIIHEGRNHQVKKMFKAIGFPVIKLKREKIGEVTLDGLTSGKFRKLTKQEINGLLNN